MSGAEGFLLNKEVKIHLKDSSMKSVDEQFEYLKKGSVEIIQEDELKAKQVGESD